MKSIYSIECKRDCKSCKRTKLDAVRVLGPAAKEYPGLRMSRHFDVDGRKFCVGSLAQLEAPR